MTALHAMKSGQISSKELGEAGELEQQQEDLAEGEGCSDGWQDVGAAGIVRGASQVQERDPLEAFRQEFEDVDVELVDAGAVEAEAEVDVGEDEGGHSHDDEDDRVGDVELVEGPSCWGGKIEFGNGTLNDIASGTCLFTKLCS